MLAGCSQSKHTVHLMTASHIVPRYNPLKHIPYKEQNALKNHACAVCISKKY